MKVVNLKIEGVTPLLVHKFSERAESEVTTNIRGSSLGKERGTPKEQAESVAYRNKEKRLYIPASNLYRSLIEAGKFHKNGKKTVTTQKNSLVPAGVSLIGNEDLPLTPQDYEVDSRPVVIPSTGGRIMRHRPRWDKWSLSFSIIINEEIFTETFVRQLVDDAGQKIGLGDFRPDRKGLFGQFRVVHWNVKNPNGEKV